MLRERGGSGRGDVLCENREWWRGREWKNEWEWEREEVEVEEEEGD